MIPKRIFYCWFGNKQKVTPQFNNKIDGYEIIEVNDSNFDIQANPLTKKLYEDKKFSFLTDYVRLCMVYKHGGFAIDADVVFNSTLDKYLNYDLVGMEMAPGSDDAKKYLSAFFGATKNHYILKALIDHYDGVFNAQSTVFGDKKMSGFILRRLEQDQPLLFENTKWESYPQCVTFRQYYNPSAAVVSLTDECNMRCEYCFTHFNPRRSSFEVVDKTCEFLLLNKKGDISPSLTFFGGEPMLEFDTIIKPIVEKYKDEIGFSITSNGTLLNEDAVDFLADNNVPVLLSIDGDKTTQNRQRSLANGKESFDKVYKNIPYLLLRLPDTVFRSTLTRKSIPELYNNMKFAERMGFKHYTFIPNVDEEYSEEDGVLLQKQFDRFAIEAMEQINKGEMPKLRVQNFSLGIQLLKGIFENNGGILTTLNRCGLCTTSMGVDVEGKIHACQENNSTDDEPLGSVYDGINQSKRKVFLNDFAKDFDTFASEVYSKIDNKHFAMFLVNSMCPKKLYSNSNYTVPYGWYIYAKALFNSSLSLYKLYRYAANPLMADYLGIEVIEGGIKGC